MLANNFVRGQLMRARALEKSGKHPEALEFLGNAIHTLQDATSPAHNGFQEWNEKWDPLEEYLYHIKWELYDPGHDSELDRATARAWNYFKGTSPLPNDFFPQSCFRGTR